MQSTIEIHGEARNQLSRNGPWEGHRRALICSNGRSCLEIWRRDAPSVGGHLMCEPDSTATAN